MALERAAARAPGERPSAMGDEAGEPSITAGAVHRTAPVPLSANGSGDRGAETPRDKGPDHPSRKGGPSVRDRGPDGIVTLHSYSTGSSALRLQSAQPAEIASAVAIKTLLE